VLTSAAMRHNIADWEVFTGIPGTLGGSVFMNAGTNLGEIGNLIKRVWIVTRNGNHLEKKLSQDDFSYRGSKFLAEGEIIWQVEITSHNTKERQREVISKYLQKRRSQQPLDQATCGCTFKNYTKGNTCRAGLFIDIMGLSGFGMNGLKVSNQHANFIEHHGGANVEEFFFLVDQIKEELLLNYGISFEEEFQVLGKNRC
jgi:UDP-N-acetylmuramate dehydrogenase